VTPVLDIDRLLDDPDTKVVVCCGSGGVGKTTTSAALALRAAERGRRTVVLTIDPARRPRRWAWSRWRTSPAGSPASGPAASCTR
jgi:molybdopterin-guanine dinucleotide biosynthesis protein